MRCWISIHFKVPRATAAAVNGDKFWIDENKWFSFWNIQSSERALSAEIIETKVLSLLSSSQVGEMNMNFSLNSTVDQRGGNFRHSCKFYVNWSVIFTWLAFHNIISLTMTTTMGGDNNADKSGTWSEKSWDAIISYFSFDAALLSFSLSISLCEKIPVQFSHSCFSAKLLKFHRAQLPCFPFVNENCICFYN